jgi:ribosomal protein L7/L12
MATETVSCSVSKVLFDTLQLAEALHTKLLSEPQLASALTPQCNKAIRNLICGLTHQMMGEVVRCVVMGQVEALDDQDTKFSDQSSTDDRLTNIVLLSIGNDISRVVKFVRNMTDLSLKEVADKIAQVRHGQPVVLLSDVPMHAALAIKDFFEEVSCDILLEP